MARRKRRAAEGGHENAERWLLTYADMITLLMVLFVVMYAISNTDLRKFTVLAQSFSAAFRTDVFEGDQALTVMSGQDSQVATPAYDSGQGVIATDYRAVEATMRDYAVANGLASSVSVERVPEGIAIRISEALLFQSGRARLDDRARKVTQEIATIVGRLPNALRIEGHTDDLPPTGPFYASNWELSTARALAVLDALRGLGVSPDRLSAAGYAGYRPLVANADEATRARNRRVDILILYALTQPAEQVPSPSDGPFAIGGQP